MKYQRTCYGKGSEGNASFFMSRYNYVRYDSAKYHLETRSRPESRNTRNRPQQFERKERCEVYDISIIGAAIIDILAAPVNETVFSAGSCPMDTIQMSFGGDALNEAVILSRLGKRVQLITKVGEDEAGKRVLNFMEENRLSVESVKIQKDLATGINIVLINEKGERHFLTNPHGSLRKLAFEDIDSYLDEAAPIVSFAGMFVSPLLNIEKMKQLFARIKKKDRFLAVDMTKAKKGETLEDLKELLPYIDSIFPNEEEIALLTGERDPFENAKRLVSCGVKTAVVKCGANGCVVADGRGVRAIPAVPVNECLDTTGAGDSFAAGFLWGLANGWKTDECARFACAAASCTVEAYGAVGGIHSLEDVKRRILE